MKDERLGKMGRWGEGEKEKLEQLALACWCDTL